MAESLRILQICHKPPRPAVDGGCIAMDSLTSGLLLEGHRVKVLSLHTHKHPYNGSALDEDYVNATRFEAVFADTELNVRDAASHVITGESYHLSRFHVPEMDRAIEQVLREEMFDVILLESLFTTSYIPAIRRLSDAEVVLRAHNVEHHLWEEVTESMTTGPKKWLLSLFQAKLRDEELRLLGAVDAVAAITEKDAAWFREAMTSQEVGDPERVVALPFGLDVDHTPHAAIQTAPERILHLGAMDWTPNQQGVMWLLEHVWPLVRERHADAELDLAGRHMPEELASIPEQGVNVLGEVADAASTYDTACAVVVPLLPEQGVNVLGEVADAASTYDTACAVVVPLHAGSGMRIKLAEALAAGRPVVTTSKGMEGLDLEHGVHVLVADTAEAMSNALVRVLTDAELALQLGRSGRQWALENMGHRARAKTLTQHLSQWVRA